MLYFEADDKVEDSAKFSTDLQLNCNNIKCLLLSSLTNKPPNPSICCDMPAYPHQSDGLEWKIFNTCFHSFHIKCLQDVGHCPVCQGYFQLVIEQLSTTAQDSIFNSQENGATPSTNPKNRTEDKPPKVQEETNEVL